MQTSQFANLSGVALGLSLALAVGAQPVSDAAIDQLRRAQERETQQRQRQETGSDVRLPSSPGALTRRLPEGEEPCFPIRSLQLQGQELQKFDGLLDHADGHAQLDHPDPVQGRCLGAQGIQTVIDRLQNTLIARGYTTTRVLAPAQNLQSGTLVLTLVPGYVGEIRWAPGTDQRASRWNIMPMQTGVAA